MEALALDQENKLYTARQVYVAMLSSTNVSFILSSNFRVTLDYIRKKLLIDSNITMKYANRGVLIKVDGKIKLYIVEPLIPEEEGEFA